MFCKCQLCVFFPEPQLGDFLVLWSRCAAEQMRQLHMWNNNPQAASLKDPRPFLNVLQIFIFSCFSLPDLIYCGRKLRDDQTLDFYGIQSGSTVHVLRKSWPEPDQKPGEEKGFSWGCV